MSDETTDEQEPVTETLEPTTPDLDPAKIDLLVDDGEGGDAKPEEKSEETEEKEVDETPAKEEESSEEEGQTETTEEADKTVASDESDTKTPEWDKATQQNSQNIANLDKKIDSKFDELKELLIKAGESPTAKQEEKIEKAKEEVVDILAGKDDDDILTVAEGKALREQLKGGGVSAEEIKDIVTESLVGIQSQVAETKAKADNQEWLKTFEAGNPRFEGKGPEVLAKYQKLWNEKYSTEDTDGMTQKVYDALFKQVLDEAMESVTPAEAPKEAEEKVVPASANKPSTEGTKVKKQGASASTESVNKKKAFDPLKQDLLITTE